MSSKDKKLVQDRVNIPGYGDMKIEEAKGKLPHAKQTKDKFVNTLIE